MFDERTIELFKLRNNIKAEGDITLEMFTTYINGYISVKSDLTMTTSTLKLFY